MYNNLNFLSPPSLSQTLRLCVANSKLLKTYFKGSIWVYSKFDQDRCVFGLTKFKNGRYIKYFSDAKVLKLLMCAAKRH